MSSIQTFTNLLSEKEINYLLNLPDVIGAKEKIDKQTTGSVYFSIEIPTTISQILAEKLGVSLHTTVPMRWIKGDTFPHIDRGPEEFETTHLVYLTNSPGELVLDGVRYPIQQGSGHIFSKGVPHETVGTGDEPRLLLGPMSERCVAVGGVSIIYIRQNGAIQEFSNDLSNWFTISWPFSITGGLPVEFITDITLTSANQYIVCNSDNITIGSSSLKGDGTRPVIQIDGVLNYPGFIQNGDVSLNGQDGIRVLNLKVDAINGASLSAGAGWIAQGYFAKGTSNNYIVNCSSTGIIPQDCGGIVGSYAASSGGQITIIGCSSSGQIEENAGGIVSSQCGNVTCDSCWSTGLIGIDAGGIIGRSALGTVQVTNCYSEGNIGANGGGIIGSNCSGTTSISACYSKGTIKGPGGGILGYAGNGTITNCYSIGTIDGQNAAGGIYGSFSGSVTATHCYACGANNGSVGGIIGDSASIPGTCFWENGWTNINAASYLQGAPTPNIGASWVYTGLNSPYELRNMGYTPYTINNITGTPSLNSTFNVTLSKGSSSGNAIISGKSYTILEKSGGGGTITINSTTGAISTTSGTNEGVYTLYIRNNGSYHISTVSLTVTGSGPIPCLLEGTMVLTPKGYTNIIDLEIGDTITTSDRRQVKIVNIKRTMVSGNLKTYPCFVAKESIGPNYPQEDLKISQDHLIRYRSKWIVPKRHFPLDKTLETIRYYHLELENYITDHLVINGGTIVESLGISCDPSKQKQYTQEYNTRAQPKVRERRAFSVKT